MSVGGPQIPQNQQNIGHSDPVQQPGQDAGKVKTKKSIKKQIAHQLAKLLPNKAKKLFTGHRSVQALHPKSVEATPGLKDSPVKLLSVKPLSERNAQPLDVQTKLGLDNVSLRERRDSLSSVESGFVEGDNFSVHSTDSYASIRSDNSDDGYDSVKLNQSEFIDDDNGYMTADEVKKSAPAPKVDLEDEDQYALVDDLNLNDTPDTPEVSDESGETLETNIGVEGGTSETNPKGSNTGENSGDLSGEPQTGSVRDEPTISGEDVLARKFAAYEQFLDNDDFGALEEKLANTNSYQTTKKVAQLALEKQGKNSFVFMIAQNRMQELKADQLFNELGGYSVGTDYSQIRQQAAEMMDQSKYSEGYQERVLELVDQRLQEYEARFEGMTPFSHLDQYDEPQPVPQESEQLMDDLSRPEVQETKVRKKRGGRLAGFLRRGR